MRRTKRGIGNREAMAYLRMTWWIRSRGKKAVEILHVEIHVNKKNRDTRGKN